MDRRNAFHVRVSEPHLTFILGILKNWSKTCLLNGTIQVFACDSSDHLFSGIKLKALSIDFDVEALFNGVVGDVGEKL